MMPILMSGLQWQACNFRRHTAAERAERGNDL